jgi:hypothetical protein
MKLLPSFRPSFPMPILSSFATSSAPDSRLTWSRPPMNSSLRVIRSDRNMRGRRVLCRRRPKKSRRTVSNNPRPFRTEEASSRIYAASSARATVLPVRYLQRQARRRSRATAIPTRRRSARVLVLRRNRINRVRHRRQWMRSAQTSRGLFRRVALS